MRLTDPMQQVEIDAPEKYTLTFLPDGTIQIQADCNKATASCTAAEDGALTISPGITTLMACPPGSHGEELLQKLSFAARYFFRDGHLFIDLMADGGTIVFAPAGDVAQTTEEAAGAGLQLDPDTERVTPSPALSEREPGITQVPCTLGMPNGPNEVEGETSFCGILF